MKLATRACAIWIGIAMPTIAFTTAPSSVMAEPKYPSGFYLDRDWGVALEFKSGTYHYRGTNNRTGKSLALAGASVSGTKNRRIYTWNNAGIRYRVTWQPSDPGVIRIQVINPNGQEQLNRLLNAEDGC